MLADFSRALELSPDWDWALTRRAEVYLQLGDRDRAAADYERLAQVAHDPRSKEQAKEQLRKLRGEGDSGLMGLLRGLGSRLSGD